MKQVIQSYRTGELWLAEVPAPAGRPNGVIVRTAASLVSAGTERMIIELAKKSLAGKAMARPDLAKQVLAKIKTEGFTQTMTKVFAKLDTPIPLGYATSGTVVEVGEHVSEFQVGDRVACGGAGYATHAEYNFVPKNLCVKIPDNVSFQDACFTTLGSIAMQGVRQADPRLGERVAVIGLGLLGLLAVQLLKAAGCAVIGSDPDPYKCDLAQQLGADTATSGPLVDTVGHFTEGHGADAVIITAATTSNGPIETAAEIARTKGRVVVVGVVGMNVPRDLFYKKELDLRLSMSYGPGRYDPSYEENGIDYPFAYVRWTEQRNMASFLYLVAAGKVAPDKLATHEFPIDRALEAYQLLEGKSTDDSKPTPKYLGILIHYPTAQAENQQQLNRTLTLRPATSVISEGKLGIGFVGAGNFAKSVLLPAIRRTPSASLVGICTATGTSATETGKKYGFQYATTDWKRLLADPDVNAIFVTTRHNSHSKFACEALAAGKHVFVEKPLCIERQDLTRYEQALAKTTDKPPCLMVGYNRRFSTHTAALRRAFESHRSPIVVNYRVNAGVIPPDTWIQDASVGGGRILGEVCHFVDFIETIIGAAPSRVFASCVRSTDTQIVSEDSVAITINYTDGSLATIQYLSHGSPQIPKEYVEIVADGVTAIVDNFCKTTFHGSKHPTLKTKQDKGFDAEISAFFNTIRHGGDWPIPLESMLRTTQVTFAVLDSLRSGTAVDLD